MYSYNTVGTCSKKIDFELEDGIITNVKFHGGCQGNLEAVAALVVGKKADEVIELLKNIDCKGRGTSCPAQLAKALAEVSRT